jgi:hypothetical protein
MSGPWRSLALMTFVACQPFSSVSPSMQDAGVEAGSVAPSPDAAATDNSPYRAAVLADGPIAYWRLGETQGPTAKDEVGSHDGTYNGGCTWTTQGAVPGNGALSLADNSNCEVDVGDAFQFENQLPFTVEAWASTTSQDNNCCSHIFTHEVRRNGPQAGYALLVDSPKTIFAERVGGADVEDVPIATNRFVYVVLTYDGSAMKLYVDGDLGNTANNAAMTAAMQVHAFIGSAGGENYFRGAIDEVAIYDKPLSADRIAAHLQAAH